MNHLIRTILSELSWTEVFAALTGLISVYLTVKNNIWNWPWGIVSVFLYGWVFYRTRVYANMDLQIYYFLPIQFYGWWVWAKGGPKHHNDLPITILSWRGRVGWALVTVALSGLIGVYMAHTDDPLPYSDGAITAMSIVAQFLDARKKFENWILWIMVDVISVFYFFPKQKLPVTTGLYAVFLILAIMGAVEWLKIMKREAAHV